MKTDAVRMADVGEILAFAAVAISVDDPVRRARGTAAFLAMAAQCAAMMSHTARETLGQVVIIIVPGHGGGPDDCDHHSHL